MTFNANHSNENLKTNGSDASNSSAAGARDRAKTQSSPRSPRSAPRRSGNTSQRLTDQLDDSGSSATSTRGDEIVVSLGRHVVKARRRGKKRRWVLHFTWNGQHTKESVGHSDRRAAVRRAWEIHDQLAAGTFAPKRLANTRGVGSHSVARGISSLSVADWAKRFIDEKKRSGVRPKSIAKIGEAVDSFVATCSARKVQLMRDVTADDFHAHRDVLQTKRNNDPKTIYTKSIILKEFVRAWCDADPSEPRNPLARVRLREVRSPKQPAPPIDQLKDVVDRTHGDEHDVLSILLFTGCRVGDVLRLRAADVDLKRGWITFGSTPHGDPKKHGLVRVPVHPKLLPILTSRLQNRRGDELVFDNGMDGEGRQKPLPERRVNAAVARAAKALGLPVGRPNFGLVAHSFRHGFKTYCINQGVPQFVVDAWQGHAGDGSASSMYYQLTDDESQRRMKSLAF